MSETPTPPAPPPHAGPARWRIITARTLTVTGTGTNKIYDGLTTASITLADDRIAGDVFTTTFTTAAFADKNVGAAKPITVNGIAAGMRNVG